MIEKLKFPHTPEEYTLWALEFSEGFYSRAIEFIRNNNDSLIAVLKWVEYTLRKYPEYLTVDVYATYFNVWVCGIFVHGFQSRTQIEMIRNIIDCDKCEKRIGSSRTQVTI
jgi:hypothetical protein